MRLLAACLVFASVSVADTITFEDQTFDDTDWNGVVVAGPAGGQTAVQIADGGNSGTTPDPFRAVTTNTNSVVFFSSANSANVYDLSAGAINSIDFSIDFKNISFFGQGQAVTSGIEQNGIFYRASTSITGPAGFNWMTDTKTGLTAVSFIRMDSVAGNPDFSTSGSPITFGFVTANSGGNTIQVGYDNWSTTLTTASDPVPEPGTFALFGLAALGAYVIRRRRKAS